MQLPRIHLSVLSALLLAGSVLAGPPQRLIIQFDSPLSAAQKRTLDQQLRSIINSDFSVLPHSTDQRWIIVIHPALDNASLEKADAAISRLEHVEYAEPDQVLDVFR